MQCDVVAVGTELLLGQVTDTNSTVIAQQLALAGIDSYFQVKVGDNHRRIVDAITASLERSDALIVCGGLGPTQDDITREAMAEVMGVRLEEDGEVLRRIQEIFAARNREMAASNVKQAQVPSGATVIPQTFGTAPGLICPVGDKVVYLLPGVPSEMEDMLSRAVIPDLRVRSGTNSTIVSRVLRTWGLSESALSEVVAPRLSALDDRGGNPTIAFLASGVEGIKLRITAKAADESSAFALIDEEDAQLRVLLGTHVFGVDDETMEDAVGRLLERADLSLGLAESMTAGLIASRLVNVAGSSKWFLGSVVSYSSDVKFSVLDVPVGPVVSEKSAMAMAEGACRVLGSDVGLSVTGVAGPAEQDGMPVGTVFVGLSLDGNTEAMHLQLPGDRDRIRQYTTISALDLLRRRLMEG